VKTHRDLDVWHAAIELAREVYARTKDYPKEEIFGLTSQMRRCAVSIASNIAEGAARNSKREFLQFLYVALGSASELDTQIEISKATRIASEAILDKLQRETTRVKMMLHGLMRSLKNRKP
jgi:four helix bundle protein